MIGGCLGDYVTSSPLSLFLFDLFAEFAYEHGPQQPVWFNETIAATLIERRTAFKADSLQGMRAYLRDIFAEAVDQDFLVNEPARTVKVPAQLRGTDTPKRKSATVASVGKRSSKRAMSEGVI